MKAKFKYPRTINGNHYTGNPESPHEHELPDHFHGHWFFKALVQCGDVEVTEAPSASSSPGESVSHSDSPEVDPSNKDFELDENGKLKAKAQEPAVSDEEESEVEQESEHTLTDHGDGHLNDEGTEEQEDSSDEEESEEDQPASDADGEVVEQEEKSASKAGKKKKKSNSNTTTKKRG